MMTYFKEIRLFPNDWLSIITFVIVSLEFLNLLYRSRVKLVLFNPEVYFDKEKRQYKFKFELLNDSSTCLKILELKLLVPDSEWDLNPIAPFVPKDYKLEGERFLLTPNQIYYFDNPINSCPESIEIVVKSNKHIGCLSKTKTFIYKVKDYEWLRGFKNS